MRSDVFGQTVYSFCLNSDYIYLDVVAHSNLNARARRYISNIIPLTTRNVGSFTPSKPAHLRIAQEGAPSCSSDRHGGRHISKPVPTVLIIDDHLPM
ncbi:MAG: hypothetical protein M3294_07580 [Pseudomonadota bacterium]|nr:hypothetical protein [Pseudomonadota bacterium]